MTQTLQADQTYSERLFPVGYQPAVIPELSFSELTRWLDAGDRVIEEDLAQRLILWLETFDAPHSAAAPNGRSLGAIYPHICCSSSSSNRWRLS